MNTKEKLIHEQKNTRHDDILLLSNEQQKEKEKTPAEKNLKLILDPETKKFVDKWKVDLIYYFDKKYSHSKSDGIWKP